MSDTASSIQTDGVARGDSPAPLTSDRINTILADFRRWLESLARDDRSVQVPSRGESVDLFTLVGQFTALRHEVNMQTKAVRAATEQSNEVLKQLALADPDDTVRPLVKVLIDIADALMLSLKQVEKAQTAAEEALSVSQTPRRGFFARFFAESEQPTDAGDKLRRLLASVGDGYALSLRRIERLLPEYGLESFTCVNEAFDPELMEVLEVVTAPEQESGKVVEEVRRGYLWNGKLIRFALVKVAR